MCLTPAQIVICCDGTWCSDATSTVSNIKILANSFAGIEGGHTLRSSNRISYNPLKPLTLTGHHNHESNTHVFYFQGVAASRDITHAEYLLDGAVANKIRDRCVEVYEAIVSVYDPDTPSQIWLFGHSRYATVCLQMTIYLTCPMRRNLELPALQHARWHQVSCARVLA